MEGEYDLLDCCFFNPWSRLPSPLLNLVRYRHDQCEDQRCNDAHSDIYLDGLFYRPDLSFPSGARLATDEFAHDNIQAQQTHRQIDFSRPPFRICRIDMAVDQQHGADQKRIGELAGAAFKSKGGSRCLHFSSLRQRFRHPCLTRLPLP